MIVKCKQNTGKYLRIYEDRKLKRNQYGRFGSSENTTYSELDIGKQYIVMGIICFEQYIAYLIDSFNIVNPYPCYLFDIIDNSLNSNWYIKVLDQKDSHFPDIQSISGYYELVFDENHYEKLIDDDYDSKLIYYKRKIETEKELEKDI